MSGAIYFRDKDGYGIRKGDRVLLTHWLVGGGAARAENVPMDVDLVTPDRMRLIVAEDRDILVRAYGEDLPDVWKKGSVLTYQGERDPTDSRHRFVLRLVRDGAKINQE